MTVADLSQNIQVYRIETITRDDGTSYTGPVLKFETYANVVLMSEREKFQQGINTDTAVYKIVYRFLVERLIKKGDTVKWDGQDYIARSFSKEVQIKTKRWFKNSMALQGA